MEAEGNLEVPKGVKIPIEGITESTKLGNKTKPINLGKFPPQSNTINLDESQMKSAQQLGQQFGQPYKPGNSQKSISISKPLEDKKVSEVPHQEHLKSNQPSQQFLKQPEIPNESVGPFKDHMPGPGVAFSHKSNYLIIDKQSSNDSKPSFIQAPTKDVQGLNFRKNLEEDPIKDSDTKGATDHAEILPSISQTFVIKSDPFVINLTSYFCSKIIPSKINNHNTIFNTQMSVDKIPSLKCKKCHQLKLKITLECSHKICMYCFTLSIENYIKNPSQKTFLKTSCQNCKVIFSDNDLKNTLLPSTYKNFIDTCPDQTCNKCNIKKNLRQDYLTELICLHMCGSCYVDEIYSGSTKCFCCNFTFKNIDSMKNRYLTCLACKTKGLMIESVYRSFHKGHIMCYECLNRSIEACSICNEKLSKRERKALSTYINKTCNSCTMRYALADFLVRKDYKEEFLCITCHNENLDNEENE
ncbi:hypothetical protein SteCoe_30570 [Stentor coeruleus]|uniref:RING-type domain-containing protein n=1 Tax=Stentor coeruleus TaxID=5963 RepID=A0A1R2B3E2_9CILI|nr:hypothetical protein SteCoe_30570 [Stentor coeruleus]